MIRYQYSSFDSNVLGLRAGNIGSGLIGGESAENVTEAMGLAASEGVSFLHFRVNSTDTSLIREAENLGFRIVDVLLQVRRNLKDIPEMFITSSNPIEIRSSLQGDADAIGEITRENMAWTRFHVDPRVGPAVAGKYYEAWIRNIIAGKTPKEFGVACRTALVDGKVAGYMATAVRSKVGRFMLMTISSKNQRQGIAKRLANDALWRCQKIGCASMETGVLLRSPVINLYMKMGYQHSHSEYSMHWWRRGGG